jgi:hypothetical protein
MLVSLPRRRPTWRLRCAGRGPRPRRRLPRRPRPGSPRQPVHGAHPVARRALALAPRFASLASPITINGAVGALFGHPEDLIAVIAFTVTGGRIAAIDLIADQDKLRALTLQHRADHSQPE